MLHILAEGVGYAGSIALDDGTIVTVTGDGEMKHGKATGRGYTLQAIRWKPPAESADPPPSDREVSISDG